MASRRAVDLGLAALSAILLVLSVPKFDLSHLAWVALAPLLVALDGKSVPRACGLAFVTGIAFFAGLFYWIWAVPAYNVFDELLLATYLSPYIGLWGLAVNWIRKRTGLGIALVAPPIWVTGEYVRSNLGFLSLPWMLLGHSQYSHPLLLQMTSVTGVYGLSFLIVLVNAAVAETICRNRHELSIRRAIFQSRLVVPTSLCVSLILVIGTAAYGFFVVSRGFHGERVTVAVVQGNIPQGRKWERSHVPTILERYASLTRQAVGDAPSLIVWPETAVPGDVQRHPQLREYVSRLAIETNTHLFVGSSEQAKFEDRKLTGKLYNSMFLFSPDGNIGGQYRKIALIPFGEYEPLRGVVPWPKAIVGAVGHFLPGDRHTVFTVSGFSFGSVLCWEIIFPDLFRQFVKRGAGFMVNATNEAWFNETAVPYQLLAMSAFRAAENRVSIVRAGNTGISAFIDPFGRITSRLRRPDHKELFVEGVLTGSVPVSPGGTLYTEHGDLFAWSQIALCAAMLLASVLRIFLGRGSLIPASP